MNHKLARTRAPIDSLMARRWSGRAFCPDRPVQADQLWSMLEAARWAPSCYGDEPWRYVVADRQRDPAAWQRGYECLSEGNRSWAVNAPLLILSCARSRFRRNDKPNRWAQHDTGAASVSLCLQATALGLMSHQMGGFDADRAREAFSVPDDVTPMAMIAIGYPESPDKLEGELRDRELRERSRNAAENLFFDGNWDRPIEI